MGDSSPPSPPADTPVAQDLVAPTATCAPAHGAELPPAPSAANEKPAEGVPIEFTADHREYFRIWITNTLLTLATLGIYAAWAKVRKKRYFYGHTRLLGHSFDYTARPRGLLIGNLLIAALFLGYSFFGAVYWHIQVTTLGVAALLLPWLIVKALAFNARNTVHRGIRLHYRARYGAGFLVYLIMPVVSILTLGLLYPLFVQEQKKLAFNFLRFGDCSFTFEGRARTVYGIYLCAVLIVVFALVLYGILLLVAAALIDDGWKAGMGFQYLNMAFIFCITVIARMYVQAEMFNYTWSNLAADAHRFRGNMKMGRLAGIHITNTLAIVFTLGLALPWAQVRLARYKLSCLTFVPAGPLDDIEAFGQTSGSAVSDAAADFFGLDIGL